MALRYGLAFAFVVLFGATPVLASPKAAVFPFDLVFQQSEEDFFSGPPKATPEEVARLNLVRQELTAKISAQGKVELVDISPVAVDIAAAAPLNKCNGCEMDFAKKLGLDILYLGVVEKASATLLNMTIIVVDVGKGGPIMESSAVVHGNTDDAWLGVTRWLAKNRILKEPEAATP